MMPQHVSKPSEIVLLPMGWSGVERAMLKHTLSAMASAINGKERSAKTSPVGHGVFEHTLAMGHLTSIHVRDGRNIILFRAYQRSPHQQWEPPLIWLLCV